MQSLSNGLFLWHGGVSCGNSLVWSDSRAGFAHAPGQWGGRRRNQGGLQRRRPLPVRLAAAASGYSRLVVFLGAETVTLAGASDGASSCICPRTLRTHVDGTAGTLTGSSSPKALVAAATSRHSSSSVAATVELSQCIKSPSPPPPPPPSAPPPSPPRARRRRRPRHQRRHQRQRRPGSPPLPPFLPASSALTNSEFFNETRYLIWETWDRMWQRPPLSVFATLAALSPPQASQAASCNGHFGNDCLLRSCRHEHVKVHRI